MPARAHVSSGLRLGAEEDAETGGPDTRRSSAYAGTIEQDKELRAIFERTYGPVKRRDFRPTPKPTPKAPEEKQTVTIQEQGPEYLLVDGYNIIFAWD